MASALPVPDTDSSPSLAADWLPKVLAGFRARYPAIELQVADVPSGACIDAVRERRADSALAATRADAPELRAERFCSDAFHLVCPEGPPLLTSFTSVLEVDQLATVGGMVRAGLGVSVVPALTLHQFEAPGLATRPLRWKGLTRHVYPVQKRERALSIAAQALEEWLLANPPVIR